MNNSKILHNKILNILKSSKKVLITTHTNPDGDAIGSALALYHYLIQNNVATQIIISDDAPRNLLFLADSKVVESYNPNRHNSFINSTDTIVFLDLNDISRTRLLSQVLEQSTAFKIVIDHHTNPKNFANLLYFDTEVSSTGELIYRLLTEDENFNLSQKIAECIYVAIMTDTGSFRYQRTTSEVHRIIAHLIDAGADPYKIYDFVHNQNPLKIVRLLGIALSKMQLHFNGRVCIMTIGKDDFASTGTNYRDTEFFVDRTLSVEGVQIGILLTEVLERGEFKISIRSKGDIQVNSIANSLGGGGHVNAAGATIKSQSPDTALQSVINQLKKIYN